MITFLEKNKQNADKIFPCCVKNRFDLCGVQDYELIHYVKGNEDLTIMVQYEGTCARLGLYLVPVSDDALKKIVKFLFRKRKNVAVISYEYGYKKIGQNPVNVNHFRIPLPETRELLDARLSKKGRYNIAREKRILETEFGRWAVHEYAATDQAAQEGWKAYFAYKALTHGSFWADQDWKEHCKRYGVTTVYVLTLGEEEKVAAVILSCEQCPVVYIENLTYDSDLAKYSLGQILYDEYLKILIDKGFGEIFLLGGNYSYKKRYGSQEEQVYNCRVGRNEKWIRIKVKVWKILAKLKLVGRQ